MTPERHDRIYKLCKSVLEIPQSERLAYLEQACLGDQELFQEVTSLLDLEAEAQEFIELPALCNGIGSYL